MTLAAYAAAAGTALAARARLLDQPLALLVMLLPNHIPGHGKHGHDVGRQGFSNC